MTIIKGTDYPLQAERRKQILAHAARNFANHVLKPEVPTGVVRSWLCHNPRHSAYWFRVVLAPAAVIVYGDIGEMILTMSDADSLAWLRGADSMDYVLGKSTQKEKEFLPAEALRSLLELDEDVDTGKGEELVGKKIIEAWQECGVLDEQAFRNAYYEETSDSEVPDCTDWDTQSIFRFAGLRWFVKRLDTEPPSM